MAMRSRAVFIAVLQDALESINESRFFKTERGYQGELLAALKARLDDADFPGDPIIEQEYQKTIPRHNLKIRPDLIIHIPFERGLHEERIEGNFVAIEIKRNPKDVSSAFTNLRLMARELHYPLTVLVMVDSTRSYAALCPRSIAEQTVCFATKLEDGMAIVRRQNCAQGPQLRSDRRRRAPTVRRRRVR